MQDTVQAKSKGFTIVELLIVIVVIAILAAITTIAFSGMQQRAKTTAKVSTVQQAAKLVQLYQTSHGNYPRSQSGGDFCMTADNACTAYNGTVNAASNAGLMTELREHGAPPATSGDTTTDSRYGITYSYQSGRTLQNIANPVLIMFFLDGTDQVCQGLIAGMVSVRDGVAPDFVPGVRSSGNSAGKTRCYMMFPN